MASKQLVHLFVLFVGFSSISSSEEIWCDFQQSICSWTQDTGDDFNWSRQCSSTPSLGTGPSNGQGGLQCDRYLFIEASNPRRSGDSARIVSEPLHDVDTHYCLTFWYHMFGIDVGSLEVRLTTGDDEIGRLIWTESGQKGNEWLSADQSFTITTDGTAVVIEAVRGSGYRSDIAIDTVTISSSICPSDRITTLQPSTTNILHTTTGEPESVTTLVDVMTSDSALYEYEEILETDVPTITGVFDEDYFTDQSNITTDEQFESDDFTTDLVTELVESVDMITDAPAGVVISCDFQDSICGWTQDTNDEFDWTQSCGSTISLATGPTNGQGRFDCDGYLFIETSLPRVYHDMARVMSPFIQHESTTYCLTFWYHMYGNDVYTLAVRATTDPSRLGGLIYTKVGNQGDQWHRAERTFNVVGGRFRVEFEATRGRGYLGDTAIDSVKVSTGPCQPEIIGTDAPTIDDDDDIVITTDMNTDAQYIEYVVTEEVIIETVFPTDIITGLQDEVVTFKETMEPSEETIVETDTSEDGEPVVLCTEDHIIVQILKQDFGYADVTHLHLLDPKCTPEYNNSHVTFKFTPTSCGTLSEEMEDAIVYTNLIRSSEVMIGDGIIRNADVSIPVTCSFNKKTSVSNEFLPVFDRIAFGASGRGEFNFDMQFYQDQTFETEKQEPIIARIGDMMYFGLSVDVSDPDVVLFVDNCKAVPSDDPTSWYYVIQDGCMRDSTMQEFSSSSAHQRLFGIEAFMFLSSGSKIVLECDLVLCDERDGISRCPTSCDTDDRKRRGTSDDKHVIKRSVARMVQFVSSDDSDTSTSESSVNWLTPSSMVSMVMFILAASLCIATVIKVKQDQTRREIPT